MIKIIKLLKNDMKNTVRDKMMLSMFLIPILMIIIFRVIGDMVATTPQGPVLIPFLFVMGLISLPALFGYTTGFMFLDEKDENIFQALRVIPIKPSVFIMYRITFATIMSFICGYLYIVFTGMMSFSPMLMLSIAIMSGLEAPLQALLLCLMVKNKVAGIAFFKLISMVLMIPLFIGFTEGNLDYIFAFIPSFWQVHIIINGATLGDQTNLIALIGIVVLFVMVLASAFGFKKRVLNK
jgi:hypothetical protein